MDIDIDGDIERSTQDIDLLIFTLFNARRPQREKNM
jgi:hypothetical protein